MRLVFGSRLGDWVAAYDAAGLAVGQRPPAGLLRTAHGACVVASDLNRSVESARAVTTAASVLVDPLFREVGVPASMGLSVPLPAIIWLAMARVTWQMGWSSNGESKEAALDRARRAARRLDALAEAHRSITVLGHGFFNRLVGRELRLSGWRMTSPEQWTHWKGPLFVRG